MDFDIYCENKLTPMLEYLIDLHENRKIEYHLAYQLIEAMCCLDDCMTSGSVVYNDIECILDMFLHRLKTNENIIKGEENE